MANFTTIKFTVPDIKKQFISGNIDYSKSSVKQSNIKTIKSINANYGSLIKYWGDIFEVPIGVIIGFIATESGGKMVKPNKYLATGLMQVTPPAIYECATKWNNEVDAPLPQLAINELNKKVPEILKKSPLTSQLKNKILSVLEKDASFNIMSGTLIIRWLLERFGSSVYGGQLNKAMVAYNAGAYTKALVSAGSKAIITPIDSTSLATNLRVPSESRGYLYKMLGKDGFLSLIYQQEAL
ncbi:MAG: hypothetical protein ACOVNU_09255 [Candidatus Kapaibacteriota bacterium]